MRPSAGFGFGFSKNGETTKGHTISVGFASVPITASTSPFLFMNCRSQELFRCRNGNATVKRNELQMLPGVTDLASQFLVVQVISQFLFSASVF